MKRILFLISLITIVATTGALAQSSQSPTMQQSTSTEATRQANPTKPKIRKATRRERMEMEQGTTQPRDRKQRRLRPDSLRRGGATKIDTVRR